MLQIMCRKLFITYSFTLYSRQILHYKNLAAKQVTQKGTWAMINI